MEPNDPFPANEPQHESDRGHGAATDGRGVPRAWTETLASALAALEEQSTALAKVAQRIASADLERAEDLTERLTAQYNLTSGMARHLSDLNRSTGDAIQRVAEALPPDVTPLIAALGQGMVSQHDRTRDELTNQIETRVPADIVRRLGEILEVINGRHDQLAVLLAKSIATDPTPKLVEIAELMINQHRQTGSRLAELAQRIPGDATAQLTDLARRIPADPAARIEALAKVTEQISLRQADMDRRITELVDRRPPDVVAQVEELTGQVSAQLAESRSLITEHAEAAARQIEDIKRLWDTPLGVDTQRLEAGQATLAATQARDIADLRRDMTILLNALRQRDDEVTQLHRDVAWLVRRLDGA